MYVPMSITEVNTSNRSTTVTTPNNSSVVTTASRSTTVTPNRQALINALAVVGFIALIGASMWLAIYSTRFVPSVADRIGTAAVYFGSIFTPAPEPNLSVISTPVASTISFGTTTTQTTSTSTNTTSSPTKTVTQPKPIATTAGEKTSGVYQIAGTAPNILSGLPDLVVDINTTGYLASADSFIASSTVPFGSRPAIKFTIKNVGTNATGSWRFSVSIPTQSFFLYQSQPQQSLNPGDSVEYTLGFDQANRGTDQMISVTANFDRTVTESNPNNNSASAKVTILGS